VDRQALARRVFGDDESLQALNGILHPPICRRLAGEIDAALRRREVAGVVLDAPVLLEAGCEDLCSHLVFVESDAGQRRRRVAEQRGWDGEEWRRREKSQISLDSKRARCNYVIENRSSVSRLQDQVRQVFQRMCSGID
jgi:dephospho-CoA kinase